ncbi:ADP-ribosylglycohydrolase [Weissella muntiaci]|jgi:ADP-ribosyl-[dinitrogen reductase] hydrolase|uniref:ADP-ribosylglycohydrolase n=1 Tax=Weissella muntiaci TaxID=2508881 RepID=A0A6C2C1Y4_9LACO|nr:ADP-ribosylglycohydrolase family protein [Weissella muntiaci]TYC47807.1 ADP-ribosylglycohydrolase [Weissella muntiaci]
MTLPDNSLVNSTLGLINGDIFAQQLAGNSAYVWGADSALTLATIASLSHGYNLQDIMNRFEDWYVNGAYTAEHKPQSLSRVSRAAFEQYREHQDLYAAGSRLEGDTTNGALMRITPLVIYLEANYGRDFIIDDPAMLILHQVGGLTHNQPRSLIALGLYAMILNRLMSGYKLIEAIDAAIGLAYEYYANVSSFVDELEAFERLNTPDFANMALENLSASEDVIETLEAVIWVLVNSESFQDALNLAGQIKGNPSQILALVGAVAGIIYGHEQLPKSWIDDTEYADVKKILAQASKSGYFEIVN